MKKFISVLFIVSTVSIGFSQSKNIVVREQAWIGYFNQTRLSKRLGLWSDLHYRRTHDFINHPFQYIIRPALTYFFSDNIRLNIGYAYIHHFKEPDQIFSRNENRPWQQIWWRQKHNGFNTLQWIRFEQRINEREVNKKLLETFNFRLRYNFSLFVPLLHKEIKDKTPFFILIDEVFLNLGKEIVFNYFDQNRLFIGIGYQFTSHLNAQIGYMNLFQQLAMGNRYISSHTARFFLFHSLDLRKKESNPPN